MPRTAIYGGQHFLPLFPLPVEPLAPSQKHSRALSNSPVPGAGEAGGRGPQLGPPIVHQAPRPTSPTPPPHARLASPGQHNGATSKFSLSAVSFQGPSPPLPLGQPLGSPSTPRVGVGIGDRFSIVGLFRGIHVAIFFLINLTFPQNTSFPHLLPTRDIPGMAERKEGSKRDRQTVLTWDSGLDGNAPVIGKSAPDGTP